MITRSQMRRQLRAQGGIMNVAPRKKFLFGGLGDRFRKLVPNEIANVAVKAAPFVAPFFPGTAALMRGIGRYDQRGSFSDAFKQGLGTYAFGKAAGKLGGAESNPGFFGGQTYSKQGFMDEGVGRFFKEKQGVLTKEQIENQAKKKASGNRFMDDIIGQTMDKIPGVDKLPQIVQEKLLVGGITGGATYLYEKFLKEEPPQDEGETYEQYMARRKENVGRKMRTYMDNYFANDPEYMQLDDAGRDAFVARYNVRDGGRIGYQTGGITMANTLQQNIAANRAQAAGIQNLLNQARASAGLPTVQVPAQTTTAAPTQTTAAAPAPSITKSTSAPAQAAPTAQQIASAMLSSNPMASSGTSILPSLPSKVAVVQPTSSSQSTGMGGLLPQLTQQVASQMSSAPGVGGRPMGFNPLPPSQLPSFFKYFNTTGASVDPTTYDPNTDSYVVPNPNKGGAFETITGPFDKYGIPKSFTPSGPEGVVGNFGPGGMMGTILQGKFYPAEEAAIDGLGVQVYNQYMAEGGRVGFEEGGTNFMKWLKANYGLEVKDLDMNEYSKLSREYNNENPDPEETGRKKNAGGGIMGMPMGQPRVNKGGVTELDYRAKGGFVPVGIKEKADDVPAMLSKNEFVFTADAVRGAGNGSIEKGAQKMYDTMKNLERRVT